MTATVHSTSLSAEIEALVDGVPGWSPLDELFTLAVLARATAGLPGDIVEVGSWLGRSAIVLAAAARETGGHVHCVDLFPERDDWRRNADGSYSCAVEIDGRRHGGYEEQTVWAEPFHAQLAPRYAETPDILAGFHANLRARGLDGHVTAHRGTAATFAATRPAGFQARLIFLDGDHGYTAVRADIDHLLPYLVPGGWLCFDDAGSGYDGVDRAIAERILGNPAFDVTRQMTRKCFVARRSRLAR